MSEINLSNVIFEHLEKCGIDTKGEAFKDGVSLADALWNTRATADAELAIYRANDKSGVYAKRSREDD